jgi:hypothetical protein
LILDVRGSIFGSYQDIQPINQSLVRTFLNCSLPPSTIVRQSFSLSLIRTIVGRLQTFVTICENEFLLNNLKALPVCYFLLRMEMTLWPFISLYLDDVVAESRHLYMSKNSGVYLIFSLLYSIRLYPDGSYFLNGFLTGSNVTSSPDCSHASAPGTGS